MKTQSKCAMSLSVLACLSMFSTAVLPADFVYRDLMANTLPAKKCKAQDEAQSAATDAYSLDKHAKIFCESQGYGWHVSAQKDPGRLVCQECEGQDAGKYQCHVEDVVVSCKRLKPGSVGLFPGKG